MALSDDLRDYMAKHGQATTKVEPAAAVVIVGEIHGLLKSDATAIRTTAMTSIRVVTDFAAGDKSDDSVFPLASGSPPRIKLGALTTKSIISFSTRHPTGGISTSPFHQLRDEFSDSGQSLAEQYEHIVLHKA